MTQKKLYILFCLSLLSLVCLGQQDAVFEGTRSIVDDINTPKAGQGNVRVMQDKTIESRLAQYNVNGDTSSIIRLSDDRVNGYKIQVFSGNNQNQSKSEAEYKHRLVRSAFPEHQVEITYSSPTWRVRVGNFITRADAEELLDRLRNEFPSFSREMYVVSDVVRRPLNR